MSYFSVALQRQAEKRGLNQSDIGRQCDLSRSFICRIMSGESRALSEQNVRAILKLFSADAQAQADLIAALCRDTHHIADGAAFPGAPLVEIRVRDPGPAGQREREYPQVELSQATERAFAWLRSQCPLNPDLEQHLIGYAKLTGMK
jgi:transcriptional regulator with XRE-family HTH domain